MSTTARIALALAAGASGAVAIPPGDVRWLAWLAPALLVLALPGASSRVRIALGVAYAVSLGVGNVGPWMAPAVARYFGLARGPALAAILLGLGAIGVVHGVVLGVLLVVAAPERGRGGAIRLGAAFVVWEAARTLVVPYFPTAILGTSQVDTPLLAIARFAGIGAVSFLVAAWGAALARVSTRADRPPIARFGALALWSLVVAGAAGLAARYPPARDTATDGPLVLGVDVGAASPGEATLARQLAATILDGGPPPALVLWPESAIETDLERNHAAFALLKEFVDTAGVPVLTGGPGSARSGSTFLRYNSVHLLSPGAGLESYHKRRLMPLAESWPSWLGRPPSSVDYVSAGRALPIFSITGGVRFGTLVCFEIADADAMRDLARRGVDFLVNPTNDSWFPSTGALPHVVWARVRAVETGLPIVRVANAGPSGIIDATGAWIPVEHPTPQSFRGRVPPSATPTPFARLGNAPTIACAIFLGVCAFCRAVRT